MAKRYLLVVFVILCACLGSTAQTPFWLKNANGPGNDEILDIVESQSDYYVTGYYSNVATFDATTLYPQDGGEAFVAKLNQNGNFIWAKRIGGTNTDRGIAISLMPNGNVVVTGHFVGDISIDNVSLSSSGISQDIFIACFSSSGTILWLKKIGGLGIDIVSDIKCDSLNNVLVTGQFIGKIILGSDTLISGINPITEDYSYDIFIAKMNSSGVGLWSKHAKTKKNDRSGKIAVGADNSVFVSGNFTDTLTLGNTYNNNSLNMGFIVHYSDSGEHLWFRRVQSSVTEIMDIACTDSLLYMTGSYSGIQRFANDETISSWQNVSPNSYTNKYYVAAYNYQGILQFSLSEGSANLAKPKAICPISGGGFYLTGEFECQHTLYQFAYGTGLYISRGYKDLFVSAFSSSNSRIWAKQIGGVGVDEVNSMAINSYGNPVFAGSFTNSIASPAKNSWGNKPWYNHFTTNYGPGIYYEGGPIMSYCDDPQYNFYAVINSQGSKDILIANIADTSRSTLDIFRRSPSDSCDLSPTYGSITSFSIQSCQNKKAKALISTASAYISGINYTYNWNGSSSLSNIYSPTSSGYVIGTVSGANTCYHFTDSVLINLYPIIPTPQVTITGGNFTYTNQSTLCNRSLYVNPDSIITLTGNIPPLDFNYSWHLPNNTIQTSNVLVITDTPLGTYYYVITDTLSGCSKSYCFTLLYPDTTTGGGSGGNPYVFKFRQGSRLLEEGDTLFGCINDILELTLVNAIDTNNIVDAVVPFYGNWACSNANSIIVDPDISTLSSHFKSIQLLSDTLLNGIQSIGIDFHLGNYQNPAFSFSQQYYIHIYPQPTFPYSLTGNLESICPGDTATFTLETDLNYDLNLIPSINTIITQEPFSFYTVFPQDYYITFYDTTDMGCFATKGRNFSMSFFQAPPITVNPSNGVVCNDENVLLTIPGATEILWIGPSGDTLSNELQYTTNIPGLYFGKIVDIHGCDLITNTVNIRNRSSFGYELSPLSICPGETAEIRLFALEGDNISWLPPFSGSSLIQTANAPGIYRFTAPLCGIIDTFDVIVPGPLIYAEIDSTETSICPGETITLSSVNSSGVNLTWFYNYSTDSEIEVTEGGDYILQLTDENSCATYDTVTIIQLIAPEPPILPAYSYYCGIDSIQLISPSGDSIAWFLGNEQVAFGTEYNLYQVHSDSTLFIANYSNITGCNSQLMEYPIDMRRYLEVPLDDSLFTICQGDQFSIQVNPSTYGAAVYHLLIQLPSGQINISDSLYTIPHVNLSNSGEYLLVFEGDTTEYCRPDTVRYTLNVLPVPQLSILSSNEFLCSDETVSFWVETDSAIVDRFWSFSSLQEYQDTITIVNSSLSGPELIIQYQASLQNGCSINLIDTILRGVRPPDPYFNDSLIACSGDTVSLILPDNQTALWFIGPNQVTPTPVNTYQFNSYVNHPVITVFNSDLNGVCPSTSDTIPVLVKPRVNIPNINNIELCPEVPHTFYFNPTNYNVGSFYWKDMIADTILGTNINQLTVPPIQTTIGLFAFPNQISCGADSTIFSVTVQTLPIVTISSFQNDTICLNNGAPYSSSTSSLVYSSSVYLNGSNSTISTCYNCTSNNFILANSLVNGLQVGQNTIRTRIYTSGFCIIEQIDTFEVLSPPIPNFSMEDIWVCVGDTIQLQPPSTELFDWVEMNLFSYLTNSFSGLPIPFEVYGSAVNSISYIVESNNPSIYINSVDPISLCRSDFYQIPIYVKPTMDLPLFTDHSICENDSLLFGFSPNNELIGNYQWTLPNGSFSQDTNFVIHGNDSLAMGHYELLAYASEASCGVDSAQFTLVSNEIPIVEFVIDSFQVCTDRPWIIQANLTTNAQIDWSYNGNTSQNNPLIINLSSFVEDSLLISGVFTTPQGCVVNKSVKIAVYPSPEIPSLTIPTTTCAEDTIFLTLNNLLQADQQFYYESNVVFGENGNQYSYITTWSDTAINLLSYIYTDHCISDTLINTFKVHQLPIFNLGNDSLLFCLGVGTQLDGPSGYSSYLWNTGQTDEDIQALQTGTYSLFVTDNQGCLFTDTIFVIGEWPFFDLPNDTLDFCFSNPLLVNAPSGFDAYQWSNGDTLSSIKIAETGEYILIITDANGCSFSDTLYALGGDCEVKNQNNVFTPNGDGINDKFTINPFGMHSYKMVIHDRWGKYINTVYSTESGWDGKDQYGQDMLEGVYYFVATVEYINVTSEEIKGMIQLLK